VTRAQFNSCLADMGLTPYQCKVILGHADDYAARVAEEAARPPGPYSPPVPQQRTSPEARDA
jgi:hypothetical protein